MTISQWQEALDQDLVNPVIVTATPISTVARTQVGEGAHTLILFTHTAVHLPSKYLMYSLSPMFPMVSMHPMCPMVSMHPMYPMYSMYSVYPFYPMVAM